MSEEEKALEKIEYKMRTWKSNFAREQSIWEEIAGWISGTKGKEKDFWCRVMDLHKDKIQSN